MKKVLLLVLIGISTLNAKAQSFQVGSEQYSVQKPESMLTDNCELLQSVVIDNKTVSLYKTKPTKKYPNGRVFYISKTEKGFTRRYLYKVS